MHNGGAILTKHVITDKQIQSIFIVFWLGSIVVSGISQKAKQDTWISILIGSIMILPLIALYIRIIHLYPGLNLFEILLKIFGNIFGKIISLVFAVYAIYLGSLVIKVFTSFNKTQSMPETPEAITMVLIVLFAIWSVKSGPENIARLSKVAWLILAASISFTIIIGAKNINLNNLKPVMEANFTTLLSSSFDFCMLPLGEMVLCLSFFSEVSAKSNPTSILIKSHVALTLTYLAVALRNVLILGVATALIVDYPSYACVSIISAGDFFDRIEVLTGVDLFLAGFIKFSICLYASSLGLAKVFNIKDHKPMVVPCALLMGTLSAMLFSNSVEMFDWLKVYPIYSIPFEIILPLVIWIGAEVQARIKIAKTAIINS